jgi:DNA-binding MarR family transcriptional regulator
MQQPRRRGRRRHIPERTIAFIARLLPPIYKPFLQSLPPGLTHQQVRTLCLLDPFEPVCISALAEKIGIKKSATSIMISRLAERGLVRKERARHDRRKVLVFLTAEGERVKEAPSTVDMEKLTALLYERGFDRAIGFMGFLRRTLEFVSDERMDYARVFQLAGRRPFPSPEMPRAPC